MFTNLLILHTPEYENKTQTSLITNKPKPPGYPDKTDRDSYMNHLLARTTLALVAISLTTSVYASPGVGERYQLDRHSANFLDTRTVTMLRYKKADLPAEELYWTSHNISALENAYWIKRKEHATRLRNAIKRTEGGSYPPNLLDKIERLQKKEKTRLHSWQDSDKLSARQKQQLFDFMLGYNAALLKKGKGNFAARWPSSLNALSSGGVNYISVFKKDYFPGNRDYRMKRDDKKTQALVQKFLYELAASQKLDRLTLTQKLEVKKDYKGKLTFKWPFPATGLSSLYNESVDRRENEILYFLPYSNTYGAGNCTVVGETEGCATYVSSFVPPRGSSVSRFVGAYLAVDREISGINSLQLSPELNARIKQGIKDTARSRSETTWKVAVELSHVDLGIKPITHNNKKAESHTLHAKVERVLLLAPDDTIVWVAKAGKLRSAKKLISLETDKKTRDAYRFPSPLNMQDSNRLMQAAIYDLLLVKYFPNRLDKRMIEAMMSSRWSYEKQASTPVGGRYFNRTAHSPDYKTLQKKSDSFKNWLIATARKMPATMSLNVPLTYISNKVTSRMQCVKLQQPWNAGVRKTAHQITAEQNRLVRQCENNNIQAKHKSENQQMSSRCQRYAKQLEYAETALIKARQNNCNQKSANNTASNTTSSTPTASYSGDGPCNFPANMSLGNMQQEVQKCIKENCGPTPTSQAGLPPFQACMKRIQQPMQAQMTTAMGLGSFKPKPKKQQQNSRVDTCKVQQDRIERYSGKLEKHACLVKNEAFTPVDCKATVKVDKGPDHMKIEHLEFNSTGRCSYASGALLPGRKYYADKKFSIDFVPDDLAFPHDPPFEVKTGIMGATIQASLLMKITGVDSDDKSNNRLSLNVKVLSVDYAKP